MSSHNTLELRGANLRHATMIVNDLFPDGGKALEQKAVDMIRNLANQHPRDVRSGKSIAGAELECGMVITAEYFPNCGMSTRTRCLRLVMNDPIPNSILAPLQENPALLGNLWKVFISHVAKLFKEITAHVTVDFQRYRVSRAQPNAISVPSERLTEIGFILFESLKIFLDAFCPAKHRRGELEKFQGKLNYWIDRQLSSDAAPGQNFIAALLPRVVTEYQDEFLFKKRFSCIPLERLCNLLQTYQPSQTASPTEVMAALRKENLLNVTDSGEATRTIPGYGRYLHIDRRRLGI